jgi:hypothetical protein
MRKRRINLLNNKYIITCHIEINKGTKVFYVPPGVRVPLVEYHCSRQLDHRWRWGCQPHTLAARYPQEDSWYSFLLEAELTQGHSVAGRIRSIEKSNDIANRTRDLPACSIVPQPTMLQHTPRCLKLIYNLMYETVEWKCNTVRKLNLLKLQLWYGLTKGWILLCRHTLNRKLK